MMAPDDGGAYHGAQRPQVALPTPIAPPRGLAGLFDGYAPGQVPGEALDTSQFAPGTVYCNVYDLGDSETFRKINATLTGGNNVLVAGLFHTGIEVFGGEWCFGFTEEDRSGVSCIPPRTHPQHTYRTTVPLGVTRMSRQEVADITERMTREWRGPSYSLIHNNCQNFANALCQELRVSRIPGWVDRAARTASAIDTTSKQVAEQVQQTKEIVRSFSLQVQETVQTIMTQDEAEVERLTSEATERMRRGSLQAIELAEGAAKELADASAAAAEAVQQGAEDVGKEFQKHASDLLGEDFMREAQKGVEETQESFRAFGRGLSQTFAELWGEPRRGTETFGRQDARCVPGLSRMSFEESDQARYASYAAGVGAGVGAASASATPPSARQAPEPRSSPAASAAASGGAPQGAVAALAAPAAEAAKQAPLPTPPMDLLGDLDTVATAAAVAARPEELMDLLGDFEDPVADDDME